MRAVVSKYDRVISHLGWLVAAYFIFRGILAGALGITNGGFLTLFVVGLCYIYSQLFMLLYYKRDQYKFQYLFFSRMFVIAAIISYFVVGLFVKVNQIWDDGKPAQYVLFPAMDPVLQKWAVGGVLILSGVIAWLLSRRNRKVESAGQGKNE